MKRQIESKRQIKSYFENLDRVSKHAFPSSGKMPEPIFDLSEMSQAPWFVPSQDKQKPEFVPNPDKVVIVFSKPSGGRIIRGAIMAWQLLWSAVFYSAKAVAILALVLGGSYQTARKWGNRFWWVE